MCRKSRTHPFFINISKMTTGIITLKHYQLSPDVTAFSTTRHGGYGRGAYGGFNINRYCGDDETCIEKNLEALSRQINTDKTNIIMPHQSHGTEIRQIATDFLTLPEQVKAMILENVDALMTDVRNICIGVSTADCIPILIYDREHHSAAAIHAGWRGTAKRITQKAVEHMRLTYGSRPEALQAVIGPGISLDAFEVGDEVYDEFAAARFDMAAISRRQNKWHIDLPECNRMQLTASGLQENRITMTGICTYNNAGDYFSARRLGTSSGRIFTGIMLK